MLCGTQTKNIWPWTPDLIEPPTVFFLPPAIHRALWNDRLILQLIEDIMDLPPLSTFYDKRRLINDVSINSLFFIFSLLDRWMDLRSAVMCEAFLSKYQSNMSRDHPWYEPLPPAITEIGAAITSQIYLQLIIILGDRTHTLVQRFFPSKSGFPLPQTSFQDQHQNITTDDTDKFELQSQPSHDCEILNADQLSIIQFNSINILLLFIAMYSYWIHN